MKVQTISTFALDKNDVLLQGIAMQKRHLSGVEMTFTHFNYQVWSNLTAYIQKLCAACYTLGVACLQKALTAQLTTYQKMIR